MDSEDSGKQQQLRGVVIITLPPSDNPSLGKTITAFTVTGDGDDVGVLSDQTHQEFEPNFPNPVVIQRTPPPPPMPRLFSGTPRKLLSLLGISLFAVLVYSSVFTNTLQDLRDRRNNDEDKKHQSFVFPLYHKLGVVRVSQDLELKLGKFLEVNKHNKVMASLDDQDKLVVANAAVVDSSTLLPAKGTVYPDGLYYTYMLLGNPQKPYYLDIDTGSDLTWIQCDAPCTSCAKGANPLYKPTRRNLVASKHTMCVEVQKNQKSGHCETCQQCDYEIEYADHSSSLGVLAKDELHLRTANGSVTKLDLVFGCAYDQQGLLLHTLEKTDGILGLSRAKVSLPSQLASRGIINNVVGHCLAVDANDVGYMFLGDAYMPYWGMAWVPMLDSPSSTLYVTELVKINYGSNSFGLGGQDNNLGRVVFDSGSSYTYFTKQAYSELVNSLSEITKAGFVQDASDPTLPVCWRAQFPIRSILDVKQYFKNLSLQFGSRWRIISKRLTITPEGYLIVNNQGNVCLGILDGSQVLDGSTIILGDISLRGKLVVYDNTNKKIGWSVGKPDCARPGSFKSLPFIDGYIAGVSWH